MQDDLDLGNLAAGNGTLITNGYNINTGGVNTGGSAVLDFGTSTITCLGFYASNPGVTILGSNANLIMTSNFLGLEVWNANFNSVTFTTDAHSTGNFSCNNLIAQGNFTDVSSTINAGYARFDGNATLQSPFTAGIMELNNPGDLVQVSDVTIISDIISNGTSGFPIQIEGYNGTGTITKTSGQICLDHVLLLNLTATGGAQFFAGANGVDLGGNTGWIFGNYQITLNCTGAAGSNTIVLSGGGNPNLIPGMSVNGTGIAPGATIISIAGTIVTLSANNIAPISGGITFTSNSPCSPLLTDVWPGDANYDLTANNTDILYIGLGYGYSGPVRAGATTNWQAEPAVDWTAQFANGANLKHADTDGDGIIGLPDTLAVNLNYGLTHPPRLMPPLSSQLPSPLLYVETNPDSASLSDTVEVDIYLGTNTQMVDSIYGIAFTINFDSTLISSSYLSVDYTGCWMGTNQVDLIGFSRNLLAQGHVDMAMVRTDHMNVNGYGLLGKLGIVIVDNVGAKVTMPVTLSNITALTASEFPLTITTGMDSIVIDTAATVGIHETSTFNAAFYPNPVKDVLYINSGNTRLQGYEIYSVTGSLISKEDVTSNVFTIDTHSFNAGVYFVKLISENGISMRRIEVLRN